MSDRIKYFVSQNEILLVLTDRPALFVKTDVFVMLSILTLIAEEVRYSHKAYGFTIVATAPHLRERLKIAMLKCWAVTF